MNAVTLHGLLDQAEQALRDHGGNIAFDVVAGSNFFYEDQFDNRGARPQISYDMQHGLYCFSFGPRQTPGKRQYPTRYFNGELDGSQPEFFYSTVQQVDFAPIVERISDTQYRVWPEAMKGWPQVAPFYLYLAQKDSGSPNEGEELDPTYRFVKVNGDVARIKVTAIDFVTGLLTFNEEVILDIPLESTEEWESYQSQPLILAFFNYRIDDRLSKELILFKGDETAPSISITDTTPILATEGFAAFAINVIDAYSRDDNGDYVYEGSDIPDPEDNQEVLIMLRADSGTTISYKKVKITNVSFLEQTEQLLYTDIDPSDPFFNVDIEAIDDPFDDSTGNNTGTPNTPPPTSPAEATGKLVFRRFKINITPYVDTLAVGNDLAYYNEVEVQVSRVSDEELSVPLPATSWSKRPHNAHTLSPLKAPAYADAYNFNWAAPLPYPEKTVVEDCEEAQVNGYLTPEEISKKRLSYRRDRNSWFIGGTVFCVCRGFADAKAVEDCIVNRNFQWYFKLRGTYGLNLYHLAFKIWR